MRYFVLLHHPKGRPLPLLDEEGDLALFPTHSAAVAAAEDNAFGSAFGFDVYRYESRA